MQADKEEVVKLLQLQQVELELIRAHKKFEELPQRDKIAKLRQKKQELVDKTEQVETMLREVERDRTRIIDEDERLKQRALETQQKIDEAKGDYRAVESLSKELSGIAKRRNTLESDLATYNEKRDRVKAVEKQVNDINAEVELQEEEQISSFQKEGGDLRNNIARLEALRDAVSKEISPEIIEIFSKKSKQYGGIALARLQNGHCGVCRNFFDEGRLLQIKSEAPLSECPSCKRMLVVIDE